MKRQPRPIFLNLLAIRMGVMALVSITHRITGLLLFLLLPLALYALERSLESREGFNQVRAWGDSLPLRLLVLLALWWFLHHTLAGLRFLFIDIDRGVTLPTARRSAWLVTLASLLLLLGLTGGLLL